ncbi:uncharacterized protein LOC101853159 [Aplysia californica]|uniref:Uncharacterized protein LOC101853159 n=1 Tax=Aplysia californica TaxID=6500 RepID=A0ABM0JN22_APLCA|nr:uncharacterized protein LOC101853159 [Aplysia californica]XP_035825453.1 uncharacterized protein LOC101853159 [Aplysia californica]XP_035825454.1 uncharacterized protein LOC101853159 [Aplysia californica]
MPIRRRDEARPGTSRSEDHISSLSSMPGPSRQQDDNPPSYDEAMAMSRGTVETNLDEEEIPNPEEEEGIEGLLEYYEKLKSQKEAKTRRALQSGSGEKSDEGENSDPEERLRQTRATMRRNLQSYRDGSSPKSESGDGMEMISFLDDREDQNGAQAFPDESRSSGQPAGNNVSAEDNGTEITLSFIDTEDASSTLRRRRSSLTDVDTDTMERGSSPERKTYDWTCPISVPFFTPLINGVVRCGQRGVDTWPTLSPTKKILVVITVVLVVGLLLLVTLLPASFVYVEYYEYALSRNRVTGVIDYDTVYDTGCYLLAPQDELIRLPSTAQQVWMNLDVMTRESLGVELQIMLQYFIKREKMGQLYRQYGMLNKEVIASEIESTVKNTVVDFHLDEFRLERKKVEAAIRDQLETALAGNCCKPCCSGSCKVSLMCSAPFCLPPGQCTKGHHVDMNFFQLGSVRIPDSVMDRYVRRVVLQINAERELFVQQTAVEVKKTEQEVKSLLNRAKEVRQEAEAKRIVIMATAEARADRDIQLAYQKAMKGLFSRLNITNEENKLSFMFVKTLENMKHNVYAYNSDVLSAFSP